MAVEIPEDATCLHCGYLLRGLPTTVCPECGRAFDPHHPRSMGPFKPTGLRDNWPHVVGVLGGLGLLVCPMRCVCGYMDWFSLIMTVPCNAAIWLAALRQPHRGFVVRSLYVLLVAGGSLVLLENVVDILWRGHNAILR